MTFCVGVASKGMGPVFSLPLNVRSKFPDVAVTLTDCTSRVRLRPSETFVTTAVFAEEVINGWSSPTKFPRNDAVRTRPAWVTVMEPPTPLTLVRLFNSVCTLVSVVDRFHEEDQFVREWATFDPVSRGEPIAVREDGSVLHAERDGFIVFPNAEALPGTEWFYFAVDSDRDLITGA